MTVHELSPFQAPSRLYWLAKALCRAFSSCLPTPVFLCRLAVPAAPPPAVNSTTAVLSSKGSEEMVQQGATSFDSLQLRGTINQSYELQVRSCGVCVWCVLDGYRIHVLHMLHVAPEGQGSCMPLAAARLLAFLFHPCCSPRHCCCAVQLDFEGVSGPSNSLLTALPVPPLPLPLIIAPCAPGSQPNSALDDCIECSDGAYNLDGGECLPCPDGALPASSTARLSRAGCHCRCHCHCHCHAMPCYVMHQWQRRSGCGLRP